VGKEGDTRVISEKGLLNSLLRAGVIKEENLEAVERELRNTGGPLTAVLEKLGIATEQEVLDALSRHYMIPAIDLLNYEIDESVVELIPADFARRHLIVPLRRRGRILTVAIANPGDLNILDDLKFITGYDIEPLLASDTAILKTLDRLLGNEDVMSQILESLEEELEIVEEKEEEPDLSELTSLIEEAPVVKLVNSIITEAVRKGASDIHIEPYEKFMRVRIRIDGVLHEFMPIPQKLRRAVVSRIKVMAKLDIAERRLPQDGHIKMKLPGRTIDLRVSTLPTLFGEKVVMRILDKTNLTLDLNKLGFEPKPLEDFIYAITRPYGLILVTGPTGSGKTTTLYSAINMLNTPEVNILTAEDPVEYDFPGVNQVQVKEEIGLTFASALRSFLRQDPDIILVGEIRDHETASIAIKAALTGHLVLSTLHTNDAPSAVSRLIDMGIEPYLVAASLNLVVAQRLVRKICNYCKVPDNPSPEALKRLGISEKDLEGVTLYRGEGCPKCNNTGYSGRDGIFEVLPISPELREMIIRNAPLHELRARAVEEGMITLREAAVLKLLRGITTVDEVIRVTAEE